MDKRIIFDNGSGGVAILVPAPEARGLVEIAEEGVTGYRNETDDEFLARIAAKDVPAGVSFQIVDASAVPSDRYFRNAWKPDLSVDMPKARDIHRDKLRALRAPKLAALDVEFMRAEESGNASKRAEVASKKQALRDVPSDPEIEAASTPEELKAVMPAALG